MRLIVLDAAEHDIALAMRWYRECRQGLDLEFLESVHSAFENITAQPEAYEAIKPPYRRIFLRRFPYRVVYRISKTDIVVVAVLHTSRVPDLWKKRRR